MPSPAHASLLPMQLPLPVPDDGVVVPAAAVAELDSELIESPAAAVGAASVDDGDWSMSQFEAPAAEPAYESVLAECEDLYRQRRTRKVVTLGTGALLDDGQLRVAWRRQPGPRRCGAWWRWPIAISRRGCGITGGRGGRVRRGAREASDRVYAGPSW